MGTTVDRIAIAAWKNRVSPVFDVSQRVFVLEIENGLVARQHVEVFANTNPAHKLARLKQLQVRTLICGALSQPLANMLAQCGIQSVPNVAGALSQVVDAYLAGGLPDPKFAMPGCGRPDHRYGP